MAEQQQEVSETSERVVSRLKRLFSEIKRMFIGLNSVFMSSCLHVFTVCQLFISERDMVKDEVKHVKD